jgi:hypothetical protein
MGSSDPLKVMINDLSSYDGFNKKMLSQIEWNNALELFPRLKNLKL